MIIEFSTEQGNFSAKCEAVPRIGEQVRLTINNGKVIAGKVVDVIHYLYTLDTGDISVILKRLDS